MADSKVSRIVSAINSESEKLKDPNVSWKEIRQNIKAKRAAIMKENYSYEMVADYLFNEGYAGSFEDALIVADVISKDWYDEIVESKDLVQQIAINIANQLASAPQFSGGRISKRRRIHDRLREIAIKRGKGQMRKRQSNVIDHTPNK
jgi:hypothetical protein